MSTTAPPRRQSNAPRNPRLQALWNYVVFGITRFSTLIMTVVLARLLSPEDFGLFALGLVLLNLFDYVRDFGVTAALVQHRTPLARLLPTGLTISLLFGLVIGVAALGFAPLLADLLGHPELTPIVRALAVALLISSFNALPQATLRRGLDFGRRLAPEVSGALVKLAVGVGLAASGAGIWSLVWAQLAGSLITTVLYWVIVRPPFRLGFDRRIAVDLLRFGVPVTAVTFLAYLVYNLPATIVGRRLGAEEVGFYSLGYRLAELTVLSLCTVIGEVLFSALARIQDDPRGLADGYRTAVGTVVAITFPVGLGMAAVAPDLVSLLYGSQFAAAAQPLMLLSVFVALHSATFHAGDMLKAIGHPAILTYLSVGGLVVLVPVLWIAAGHSLTMVAAALIGVEVANFVARLVIVRRVLGLPIGSQLGVYAGPALAAAIMTIITWTLGTVLPPWPAVLRLAVLVTFATVLYLGSLYVFAPTSGARLTGAVRAARRRSAATAE
ncbi:lipopolysaccharide biosynthesis protein [Pseudonocardia ailaonensis]|uniref:Lipopolysaccharide biosynthesis protein n=1 Tax=Pseudonocardia ailaonensis TaxID=367279 RepID=A0ABN2NB28_9PSEU